MPKLFGLDIAGIVDGAIQQAGGVLTGTLIKVDKGGRTAGNITGGKSETETPYSCRGFIDDRELSRRESTLVQKTGRIISILGASLPDGIEPDSDDQVTMEGQTYEILAVKRDPAAAVFECLVER